MFNDKWDYTSKVKLTNLRLGSLHTLFANSVRTIEDISSSHNFLTGISSLVASLQVMAGSPDLMHLLQATLLSLQSAMWVGSKSLFNIEHLLRSEALHSISLPDQEDRYRGATLLAPIPVLALCCNLCSLQSAQ